MIFYRALLALITMCDFVKKYLQNIVTLISVKDLTSLFHFLLSKALFWLDF